MRSPTRTLSLGLALLLALLAPSAAQALPHGFFGIVPQTPLGRPDFSRMAAGGVETVRLPLAWGAVQPTPRGAFDWAGYDATFAQAAEAGIEVLPVLGDPPRWISHDWKRLPIDTGRGRRGWSEFVRAAVERYGRGGAFWREHRRGGPAPLPPDPVRAWQVWNEENFFYFVRPVSPGRYARLVKLTHRAVHRADPRAEVVLGGLFGRPRQQPPRAMSAVAFLERLYRVPGIRASFDAVALHPYAPNTFDLRLEVEEVRRTMADHGDRRSGLYITEMGWGSQDDPGRVAFEVGRRGQERELRDAYGFLIANHLRLGLRQVDWFSWKDAPGCNFCDSVGLFRAGRRFHPKPAWHAFVRIARTH